MTVKVTDDFHEILRGNRYPDRKKHSVRLWDDLDLAVAAYT